MSFPSQLEKLRESVRSTVLVKYYFLVLLRLPYLFSLLVSGNTESTLDLAICYTYILLLNPFLANVPISYLLKTLENSWFSGDFWGYKMGKLAKNGLIKVLSNCFSTLTHSQMLCKCQMIPNEFSKLGKAHFQLFNNHLPQILVYVSLNQVH